MVLRPWVRRARLLAGSPATTAALAPRGDSPFAVRAALRAPGAHRVGPRWGARRRRRSHSRGIVVTDPLSGGLESDFDGSALRPGGRWPPGRPTTARAGTGA